MTIPRQSQNEMRRVRKRLHAANPLCHWCGCITWLTIYPPDKDAATVDHLKPRRECKSVEEYSDPKNHVLACFECNSLRDVIDLQKLDHQREQQARLDTLRSAKRRVLVATKYLG